jgi:hypothetical protein
MPGCTAYIPPEAPLAFAHTGIGSHHLSVALPAVPAFAGIVLGTQVVMLDPLATNALGANATNLTAGRVGN